MYFYLPECGHLSYTIFIRHGSMSLAHKSIHTSFTDFPKNLVYKKSNLSSYMPERIDAAPAPGMPTPTNPARPDRLHTFTEAPHIFMLAAH